MCSWLRVMFKIFIEQTQTSKEEKLTCCDSSESRECVLDVSSQSYFMRQCDALHSSLKQTIDGFKQKLSFDG